MRSKPVILWCAALMLSALLPVSAGALTYDEAIDGDLPHPNSATVLGFGPPNPNSVKMTIDIGSDGFILDIGPCDQLDALTLTSFTGPTGATGTFHIHDGPSVSDPPLGTAYFTSFDASLVDQDFLSVFDIGPLGPGQYLVNFWHDNTPDPAVVFDLDFSTITAEYDEAVEGDLPHPNSAFVLGPPTPESVKMTIDIGSDGFILDIGPCDQLDALTLSFFTGPTGATGTFHIHDGPSVSDPPLGTAYFTSFDASLVDQDFLSVFDIGPLGPGQYLVNFWHDNTPDPTVVFDLDVTTVTAEYDEAVEGDLPHPNSAEVLGPPTPESVKMTIDIGSDGFILDIGPCDRLEALTLSFFTGPTGATGTFHIHDGPSVSDPPLGTAHFTSFDASLIDQDFLSVFDIGPLGPGQYLVNFWHDNTPDPTVVFDLDVTPIPADYDEAVEGDLPHPNSAFVLGPPTPETIRMTLDLGSDGYILDVGPGGTVDSLTLTCFSGPSGATGTFHIHDGPSVSDPPLGTAYFTSFDALEVGQDFLSLFNIGPLGPGQYLVNHWHDNSPDPTVLFTLVETQNSAPTAEAGLDQTLHAGQPVLLDGTGSTDLETATANLAFAWSFVSAPAGSTAAFDDATAAMPSFVADLVGDYEIELTVTDEGGLSASDQVTVSSENVPPQAEAGAGQVVPIDSLVTLDGGASSDADGDPLSYAWTLVSSPAGNTAALVDAGTPSPSITPDAVGAYDVHLVVDDGFEGSAPDTVTVTVITTEEYVTAVLNELSAFVADLPTSSFDKPQSQSKIINEISKAIDKIQKNKISSAIHFLDKLIERTDGCALRGAPDSNGGPFKADQLVSCADQEPLYDSLVTSRDLLAP